MDDSGQRPGDFVIASFDQGVDVAVDASVVHPLQLQAAFTKDFGAVAARREERKHEQYQQRCLRAGVRFATVVGETTGGWGPSSEAFLRKLFRAYRSRHPA